MATTGVNARGLVPARRVDGQPPAVARRYPTGSNARVLMIGDPVFFHTTTRTVQRYEAAFTTAGGPAPFGVVVGLLNSDGRPLTHVTEKQIPVSGAGFVLVADDPDLLFEGEILASVGQSNIGNFVTIASGTRVTANGNSGLRLASPVVTAAGHPFQIYSLAPTEIDGVGGSANNILVRISNHAFRRDTRIVGPLEGADA